MNDAFGQFHSTSRGPLDAQGPITQAVPTQRALTQPSHDGFARRIAVDEHGRVQEVWDPQVVAEFEALGAIRDNNQR